MAVIDDTESYLSYTPPAVRANPTFLAASVAPIVVSALLIPFSSTVVSGVGMLLAVAGIVALLIFKQHTTRLSGELSYSRSRIIDRVLLVGLVAGPLVLLVHLFPFALGVATGACACA